MLGGSIGGCMRVFQFVTVDKSKLFLAASLLGCWVTAVHAQTPTGNKIESAFQPQELQPAKNCLPCHQRQYDELRSSVKSGYRNVSPLFNGLEFASNLLNGGLLRPVYAD